MYNFDEIIDRRNTNALNTDGFRGYIFHAGPEKKFPYKLNFCYNGDNDTVPEEESAGIAVKKYQEKDYYEMYWNHRGNG